MQWRRRPTIILRRVETPTGQDSERYVEWLCRCLGFEGDELAVEIFKDLLKANYEGKHPSSTELCRGKEVTRAAVIYHLNKFIERGLIERRGREYSLRDTTLSSTIDEVEQDFLRYFKRLKEIAKKVDSERRIPVE
jgi:predicted transcriptional regulator